MHTTATEFNRKNTKLKQKCLLIHNVFNQYCLNHTRWSCNHSKWVYVLYILQLLILGRSKLICFLPRRPWWVFWLQIFCDKLDWLVSQIFGWHHKISMDTYFVCSLFLLKYLGHHWVESPYVIFWWLKFTYVWTFKY